MSIKNPKAVVVTTEHRGVFFGYVPANADLTAKVIKLDQARMCVYWPQGNRGVVGLAATGPISGSKISPAAPEMILQDVTSVMAVTEEAVKAWESAPWS